MKLKHWKYRILSKIAFGKMKKHYKTKWKNTKSIRRRDAIRDNTHRTLPKKIQMILREEIHKIERDISLPNVVYIFQQRMYDNKGKSCFNGGAERYVVDLADIIKEAGFVPVLIQYGDVDSNHFWCKKVKNLKVYGLPVKEEYYEAAIRYLKNYKFVIYSGMTSAWGKKLHPNILISHGITWDHPLWDVDINDAYSIISGVDHFVSVDTNTISWFRTTFSNTLKNLPATYIPNYVDVNRYYPRARKDDKEIHITFPRRATSERGYWIMSKAIKPILEKHQNVICNFVGFVHRNDIKNDIEMLKKAYPGRINHSVCEPDNMPEVYQNSDISIIPTQCCEGTSLSCLEAQACGNIVIATNIGGLPNLIIDNYNGFLINPTDKELIKILDFILSDKRLQEKIRKNAVSVAKEFSQDVWKKRWSELLKSFISTDGYNSD